MRHPVRTALIGAVQGASLSVMFLAGLSSCEDKSADPAHSTPPAAAPPSASATPAPSRIGRPTELVIPAIDVRERLHPVGLKPDGAMQTPDSGDAGWYRLGPRPGAPGPAVVLAHVHGRYGDDVFTRLHQLEPGDRVTVRRTDGVSTFVVESQELVAKEQLPYDRIWNDSTRPLLRLITCGGKPDPVTGRYPANTIVYARLAP